jgi:hypothetical protein
MGTSKGYDAPTDPQWAALKRDVSLVAGLGSLSTSQARRILGKFVDRNGGSRRMARGGDGTGGGRAATRTATRFAAFADAVAERGLDNALRDIGLERLVGKSAGEIALSLTDELCDDGSALDEVDARKAMSDLNKELLKDAQTYEEVTEILEARLNPDGLGNLLFRFFGNYIYHRFCRVFYERVARRHGEQRTESFLGSIRRFITSELRLQTYGRDLARVEWGRQEGQRITEDVMQQTLQVFEG